MEKRDLFAELMQGVEEMAAHREGKIVLRREHMARQGRSRLSVQMVRSIKLAGLIPDIADSRRVGNSRGDYPPLASVENAAPLSTPRLVRHSYHTYFF